jgi:hypothetical protein
LKKYKSVITDGKGKIKMFITHTFTGTEEESKKILQKEVDIILKN